jgi:hypothetical protein
LEPLLDPSQWLLYDDLDDMEKGYNNDMHDFDDFDQVKNEVHCSICHGECYTMDRHKKGPKRN